MRGSILLLAVVAVSGCTSKPSPATDTAHTVSQAGDPAAAKTAIEAANARFLDAMKRGDTATAAQNYANDALVMLPNAAPAQGHAAIAKSLAEWIAMAPIKDGKATTLDVMVAGDLALETGRYVMTVGLKGGKTMTDSGKYLTAWKRQPDGTWRIVRDINNSDLPAK